MSDTAVEYELNLKDHFSNIIDNAGIHAKDFQAIMGEVAIATAGFFGLVAGKEFLSSSVEEFNKADVAMGQLKQTLESTGNASGVTSEELKEQAESLQKLTLYSSVATERMDSVLATFTNIKGEIYTNAVPAILDLSAKMGQDLKSSAMEVGRALNDPIRAITQLRRTGIVFDAEQQKMIKTMTATGHVAQAQAVILDVLNQKFGGSAEVMAQLGTGPAQQLQNRFEDLKAEIGEIIFKIAVGFIPIMDAAIVAVRESIKWIGEHKEILKALAIGLGTAAVALGIYTVVTSAATIATTLYAAALSVVVALMNVSKLQVFVTILAAVVTVVVYCYEHFTTFKNVLLGVWEVIKEFGRIVADVFVGVGRVILGVLTFRPSMVTEGAKQTIDAIADAGTRMGRAFREGYDNGAAEDKLNTPLFKPADTKKPGKKEGYTLPPEPKTKATGSKSVTINVTIQKLGETHIEVTNIKEGYKKLKDGIVNALTGAVNDFQVVAEH